MNLIVESSSDALAQAAAAELAAFGPVTVRAGSPAAVELLHRPGIDTGALLAVLQPLQPAVRAVAGLDADVVLLLGDAQPLSAWGVRIECDSDAFASRVRSACDAIGFGRLGESFALPEDDVLTHSGASSFARRVLLWQLARLGVTAREHKQPGKASVIGLSLRDPAGVGVPLVKRFPVRVRGDDPRQVETLRLWLQQAGFLPEVGEPLTDAEALAAAFNLAPGPFGANRAPAEVRQLTEVLRDLIDDARIDTSRYPLRVLPDSEGPFAEILLPIKVCRSGRKPPYSGAFPERFTIHVRSDDIDRAEALRTRLSEAGFARIGIEEVPSAQLEQGFAIRWGAAGREAGIAAMLRTSVGTVMAEQGAGPPFELVAVDHSDPDSTEVNIDFPMVGIDDGSLLVRLSNPAPYAIMLRTPDPSEWDDVLVTWRSWGFRECTADKAEVPAARLEFDEVPAVLAERVRTLIADCSGLSVPPTQRPSDGEPALWVYLPRRPAGSRRANPAAVTPGGFDLGSWFLAGLEPTARPLRLVRGGPGRPGADRQRLAAAPGRVGGAVHPRPGGVRPLLPGRPDRRDAGPPGRRRGPARAVPDGGRDQHVEDQHGPVPRGPAAAAGGPHQPERPDGHRRAGGPLRSRCPLGSERLVKWQPAPPITNHQSPITKASGAGRTAPW